MRTETEFALFSKHLYVICTEQGHLRWGGQLLLLLSFMGAGGARIAFYTKLLPSLLNFEGAFSRVVDRLVQENFSRGKPPDP